MRLLSVLAPATAVLLVSACMDEPTSPYREIPIQPRLSIAAGNSIPVGTEIQITDDPYRQWNAVIFDNWIAWQDERNGNWDIYAYDLSAGTEHQITTSSLPDFHPAISGTNLVYFDWSHGGISGYDLSANTHSQVTFTERIRQSNPAISGNYVISVWHQTGANDLYLSDIGRTGLDRAIGRLTSGINVSGDLALHGTTAVFSANSLGGNSDIFVDDIESPSLGATALATGATDDVQPDVYGDQLVWEADGAVAGGGSAIMLADINDPLGRRQISSSSVSASRPAIRGDYVVWLAGEGTALDGGTGSVVLYHIPSDTKTVVSSWPISAAAVGEYNPDLSDEYVVWTEFRNGRWDVFAYKYASSGSSTANRAPISVSAGGPYSGNEGGPLTLSASATDPDSDPIVFTWDVGNGTGRTGQTVLHVYANNGVYQVTVTTDDGRGGSTTSAATSATISNVAPTVSALTGAEILVGESYTTSGSFTDPGTADTHTATIDYGEGGGEIALSLTSNTFALAHTYGTAGAFTVRVAVTDDDRGTGSATATVIVLSAAAALGNLQQDVQTLVDAGTLNRGQGESLAQKLQRAIDALDRGQPDVTVNQVDALVNEIEDLIADGVLTAAEGQPLIDYADRIIAAIRTAT